MVGSEFRGFFASADASALSEANSRFSLYAPGSASAITLNANDRVVITSMQVSSTAITVTIYDGTDNTVDSGEELFKAVMTTTPLAVTADAGTITCQTGTYPKVKTSAGGQVNISIQGYIVRKGS